MTQQQQPQQQSTNFLTIQTQPHNSGSSPHSSHSNLHSPIAHSSTSAASSTGLLTINCNIPSSSSSSSHQMLTPNTISNLSQIGGSTQPSPSYHYQSSSQQQQYNQQQQAQHFAQSSNYRSEFKNRRSSSEPVQDLLVNSTLVSTLQQSHEDNNHQQQQSQFHQHQIVNHNSHAIECLDAALKVRNSQDRRSISSENCDACWNILVELLPPLTLFSRLIRTQLSLL